MTDHTSARADAGTAASRLRVGLVLISGAHARARGTAGTETLALQQFSRLREEVALELIADRPPHRGLLGLADWFHRLPVRSPAGLLGFAPRLARLARRRRYDVVLSEGPVPVDALTAVACRLAGIPHVLRRHVLADDVAGPAWKRRLYRGLDAVPRSCGSRFVYLTESQRARGGCPHDAVVANGVDLSRFRPGERAERPPTVGMVGQFIPAKDWPAFLDLVEVLRVEMPELRAVGLGDGPLRGEIQRQAWRRGLADCVSFPGNVEDVRPWLAGFDVLVLTSRREGLSMACIEALAMGVPVVTTPVSGAREIVGGGAGGRIVPFGGTYTAAQWIAGTLGDPAILARAAAAARARAEERFCAVRSARALHRVLADAARGAAQ
jgi:glycosyltransferase involved in cell wall biosynthesis